jgi:hypothetical protein
MEAVAAGGAFERRRRSGCVRTRLVGGRQRAGKVWVVRARTEPMVRVRVRAGSL